MITGTITLADNTVISVTDALLVNNELSLTMSTCSEATFDVGTFNASVLKISIIDDASLDHKFDDAEISLTYVDDEENETELGVYWVDTTKTKRIRKKVTLTAIDAATKFDVELADAARSTQYTPLTALTAACTEAGVTLYNNSLSDFPNNSVTFTPSSASVQTYRDLVMWVAQLLGANAIINRDGELEIRRARYTQTGTSIDVDFLCTAHARTDIQFSDIRTYIKYLTYYSGNDVKTVSQSVVSTDEQIRSGMYSLRYNPLLDGKSATDCDTISGAIHSYILTFLQRQIKAKMFVDMSIQLGSTIRFEGGKIDIRQSIVGVVTKITWKYHGIMEVICTAPVACKGEETA